MCGGVTIRRVRVHPGASIKYKTLAGERTGTWGTGYDGIYSRRIYNARSENLTTTWGSAVYQRAVVEVESFEEKGVDFRWGTGGLTALAAIYDIADDSLFIITEPSRDGIELVHHRQPVVLREPHTWLEEGAISTNRVSNFQRVPLSDDERRRQWLAANIK